MFPESVILVVGGEVDGSESIASMLAGTYRVIGVDGPDEAVTYASDGVDLIISYLDSPGFSGLSLLRMWKSQDSQPPFLFITSGNDVSAVVEAMKLGAADCLVKPIHAHPLREAILKLLEHSGPATAGRSDSNGGGPTDRKPTIDIPPGTSLEDLERAAVKQALSQHHGNRTHAAKTLGISVRTLQRKLKAWGMPVLASFHPNSTSPGFLYTEQHAPQIAGTPFSTHAL